MEKSTQCGLNGNWGGAGGEEVEETGKVFVGLQSESCAHIVGLKRNNSRTLTFHI